jgi:hypothetical protein
LRVLGDVNGDGTVNIGDVIEILKSLAGMKNIINDCNNAEQAAFITGGEKPTIADAVEILRYLAGMTNRITG